MHRILVEIPLPWGGAIPIYSYGFMIMLAFIAGITLAVRRAKARGISPDVILDIGLYSIICGIIGARLAFVLTDPDFSPDPTVSQPILEYIAIWKGGLTFQGGLFLALAVCIWYLRSNNLPAATIADIFAPGVAIGIAIGRVGCFLNGCCWGRICEIGYPLGVSFPEGSGAHSHLFGMLQQGDLLPRLSQLGHESIIQSIPPNGPYVVPPAALTQIPVHPTQLYTTVAMIGVFLFVLWVEKKPRRFEGMVMLAFLMAYSVVRFAIEFLRTDTALLLGFGSFPGLRLGQILALITFAVAAVVFVHQWRRTPSPHAGNHEGDDQ